MPNPPADQNSPQGSSVVPRREVLLWHDNIHERLEACLLYFWRLSFGVYYDRKDILERLQTFYVEFGITSYVVYQTLGNYDLLLRLWIPRRFIAEEIMTALPVFLRGTSLENIDYIACHTRRHWARRNHSIQNDDAAQSFDVDSVDESVIAAVNAFNLEQVNSDAALSQPLGAAGPVPPGVVVSRPAGTEQLIAEELLIPVSLDTKGIRLFVLFDRAKRAGPNDHDDVLERLERECDSIETKWADTHSAIDIPPWPTGPHFSIYSGHGLMSDFLLMIRAPHGDFHEFVGVVISRLRSLGLEKMYNIRPYTYVIADQLFTDFREQRISIVSADITTDTLNDQERYNLEFKATFALNLSRWRHEGGRQGEDSIKDNVVKAVCGFLNSLEGGTLIIGVLETEREYVKAEAKGGGDSLLAWLHETFDYVIEHNEDGTLKRPLRNALIGVEHEYAHGSAYNDADKYYSALRDILKDRIDPNPLRWLRVGEREVDGRKFAVVTVRPADVWCYATISTESDPQFFVREAASTRAAKGREAELYRDADPRGLGNGRKGHRWG